MPRKPVKPAPKKIPDLSAADIGEMLGVSERTVSNWLRDKGLPCKQDRNGRRFVWDDVREWYVLMRISEAGNAGNKALTRASHGTEALTAPNTAVAEVPSEEQETFKNALRRKVIAEADLKELELASKRGEVVSIADVQTSMANVSNALRTKIEGWPTLLVGRLHGMKDRNAMFLTLTRAAKDLCRELILDGSRVNDA